LLLALLAYETASAQVNVPMHRYDLSRTGANLAETQLNTTNSNRFGKLFSYAVDGDVYTQPLVIHNVSIPGKGTHNVVYAATTNNTVYAFDADTNRGANSQPPWSIISTVPGDTPSRGRRGTLNNIRTLGSSASSALRSSIKSRAVRAWLWPLRARPLGRRPSIASVSSA